MKKLASIIVAAVLFSTVFLSSGAIAVSQPKLKDVCTFTVDKTRIHVSTSIAKNTAVIQAKCDTKKVSYDQLTARTSNTDIATVKHSGSQFGVKAVSDGPVSVILEADGYFPVLFDFAVGNGTEFGAADLPAEGPPMDPQLEKLNNDLKDLNSYNAQLDKIHPYYTKALLTYEQYNTVTTKNRKQAAESFTKLIVPNATKFLTELKKVKVNNKEISAYHKSYIKASSLQLEGYTLISQAISKSKIDNATYKKGKQKVEESKALIQQFWIGFNSYDDYLHGSN
ncbi:hypothetical protein SAMN05216312_102667 [Cohnella sp. OV330]|uniref:hypothetical protein n=1 Tax=Cohnella sp. OV330 TaxID=1855288 RepID=UPI0008E1C45D|nr:hypothetical protein [Cohnella sp. OV330]SFA98355.1 hypothetical protein SAMN05216312_102667 [Cohnella sp. OV330]